MVYGEVGRTNVNSTIDKRMINFWIRSISDKDANSSNTLFRLLKSMQDSNTYKAKWIVEIKNILDNCGFSFILHNQYRVNLKWLKTSIERRIDDIKNQNWQNDINCYKI